MGRGKVFFAMVLFIGVTVVKLMMPELGDVFKTKLMSYIDTDGTCIEVIGSLGEIFYKRGLMDGIIAALGTGADSASAFEKKTHESDGETQESASPEAATIAAEPNAETPQETEMPEAVSVFLREQKQFCDLPTPENVRTDMPELCFEYTKPIVNGVGSGFGYRVHPIENEIKYHYGTDFPANTGDDILAFADGYVYAAGESESYGKYLIVTHGGGFASVYAHCSEFVVHEGDAVKLGQRIAKVGQSGKATGPHLHFELLLNDLYLNPEYYI